MSDFSGVRMIACYEFFMWSGHSWFPSLAMGVGLVLLDHTPFRRGPKSWVPIISNVIRKTFLIDSIPLLKVAGTVMLITTGVSRCWGDFVEHHLSVSVSSVPIVLDKRWCPDDSIIRLTEVVQASGVPITQDRSWFLACISHSI